MLPGAPGHGNGSLGNSCIRLTCWHQLRASRVPRAGLWAVQGVPRPGRNGHETLEMRGGTAAAPLLSADQRQPRPKREFYSAGEAVCLAQLQPNFMIMGKKNQGYNHRVESDGV